MVSIVTATWSDSGPGTLPTTLPAEPGWNDCTDALPSSPVPPAMTRYAPFTNAPAASCTGWARDPTVSDAPFVGSKRMTFPVVCFDASSPPSTTSCFPSSSTTSRDEGAGSFHCAAVMRRPPAAVVVGADDAVVPDVVVEGARFDVESPPPPPHAATSSATAPSATTGRTARSTAAPLHTKRDLPSRIATLRSGRPVGSSGQPG